MMKRNRFIAFFLAFLAIAPAVARDVLPVTGSWINLFYQDERNKGFMKGAQIYCAGGPGVAESARQHYYLTRRVMLTALSLNMRSF